MINIMTSITIITVVASIVAAVIYGLVSGCEHYLAREKAIDNKLEYWEGIIASR